jgi:hypothetical protein
MKSKEVTILVAILAFQIGVLVGVLAHRSMQPADSPLVKSMRELERNFKTPRLEWQQ